MAILIGYTRKIPIKKFKWVNFRIELLIWIRDAIAPSTLGFFFDIASFFSQKRSLNLLP